VTFELKSFEVAIADLDGSEFGFLPGSLQVRELLPDALRPLVIRERVDVAAVFDERPALAVVVGRP